jgi:hypothetical protein
MTSIRRSGTSPRPWCRMEADGVLRSPDKSVPAEIVHESGRTRIIRLFLPGGTVIRKEPLGPHGERRVRHEVAMLERLRGVAGVAQLAEAPRYPGSVVLADAGSTSLAGEAKPLAVDELIGLAVGLGRAVAGMHRRGDAPGHQPGQRHALQRRRSVPGGLRAGEFVCRDPPGVHPSSPRSPGRWRTWRQRPPGGPAGRWISAPTCTRWARRCMSWPRTRRRSVRVTCCGSSMITSRGRRRPPRR